MCDELSDSRPTFGLPRYGEINHVNLVRDKDTGKPKGFAFVGYENQKSTILAVDNFNGAKLLGRVIRVDHVKDYKPPKLDSDESGDEEELMELDIQIKKQAQREKEKRKAKEAEERAERGEESSSSSSSSSEDIEDPVERKRRRKEKKKLKKKRAKEEKEMMKLALSQDRAAQEEFAAFLREKQERKQKKAEKKAKRRAEKEESKKRKREDADVAEGTRRMRGLMELANSFVCRITK